MARAEFIRSINPWRNAPPVDPAAEHGKGSIYLLAGLPRTGQQDARRLATGYAPLGALLAAPLAALGFGWFFQLVSQIETARAYSDNLAGDAGMLLLLCLGIAAACAACSYAGALAVHVAESVFRRSWESAYTETFLALAESGIGMFIADDAAWRQAFGSQLDTAQAKALGWHPPRSPEEAVRMAAVFWRSLRRYQRGEPGAPSRAMLDGFTLLGLAGPRLEKQTTRVTFEVRARVAALVDFLLDTPAQLPANAGREKDEAGPAAAGYGLVAEAIAPVLSEPLSKVTIAVSILCIVLVLPYSPYIAVTDSAPQLCALWINLLLVFSAAEVSRNHLRASSVYTALLIGGLRALVRILPLLVAGLAVQYMEYYSSDNMQPAIFSLLSAPGLFFTACCLMLTQRGGLLRWLAMTGLASAPVLHPFFRLANPIFMDYYATTNFAWSGPLLLGTTVLLAATFTLLAGQLAQSRAGILPRAAFLAACLSLPFVSEVLMLRAQELESQAGMFMLSVALGMESGLPFLFSYLSLRQYLPLLPVENLVLATLFFGVFAIYCLGQARRGAAVPSGSSGEFGAAET